VSFATLSNSKNKPTQFIIKREKRTRKKNIKKKEGKEKKKRKTLCISTSTDNTITYPKQPLSSTK